MAERANGRVNPKSAKGNTSTLRKTGKTRRQSSTKHIALEPSPSSSKPPMSKKSRIPAHVRSLEKEKNDEIVTYVLDTNIIMRHPNAIFMFDEHEVVICGKVWEEMDRHKNGRDEKNLNVRSTVRYLDGLVRQYSSSNLQSGLVLQPPPELQNGKPHTGKILWDFSKPDFEAFSRNDLYLDSTRPDHHVLAICLKLKQEGRNVVLISNDKLFRVFASHAGITAEEYFHDVVEALPLFEEDIITGFRYLPEGVWSQLEQVAVEPKKDCLEYQLKHPSLSVCKRNEFIIVPEDNLKLRVLTKKGTTVRARTIKTGDEIECFGIRPRNMQQEFALDVLLDPKIPAVSLAGLAGSGKTFLALAAALEQRANNLYSRILITRSPQGSDEDIGFLPGTEKEKMDPWMGGIYDNLEELVCGDDFDEDQRLLTSELLLAQQGVQMKSLNFMKGRSLRNTFIIIDEAQDLQHKTLKMIATRVGPGSKIVFLGNVDQIDNNYVSEYTNGLSVFIRSSVDTSLVGHVTLKEGERSEFATWAENNL